MALKRINKVRLLFTAHRLAICQPQKAIEKFSYALPCVCVRVCVHECEKLRNSVGIVPRRLCRNCCDVCRPLGRRLCANDSSPEWLAFHEWTPKGWGLPSVPENKCRKVDDRVWMFEKSLKNDNSPICRTSYHEILLQDRPANRILIWSKSSLTCGRTPLRPILTLSLTATFAIMRLTGWLV